MNSTYLIRIRNVTTTPQIGFQAMLKPMMMQTRMNGNNNNILTWINYPDLKDILKEKLVVGRVHEWTKETRTTWDNFKPHLIMTCLIFLNALKIIILPNFLCFSQYSTKYRFIYYVNLITKIKMLNDKKCLYQMLGIFVLLMFPYFC